MTFSTLGSLVKENDLEIRTKDLLRKINQGERPYNYSIGEIDFLLLKEYIVLKEGTLEYWITSKGKEYALGHL